MSVDFSTTFELFRNPDYACTFKRVILFDHFSAVITTTSICTFIPSVITFSRFCSIFIHYVTLPSKAIPIGELQLHQHYHHRQWYHSLSVSNTPLQIYRDFFNLQLRVKVNLGTRPNVSSSVKSIHRQGISELKKGRMVG